MATTQDYLIYRWDDFHKCHTEMKIASGIGEHIYFTTCIAYRIRNLSVAPQNSKDELRLLADDLRE